MDDAQGMERSKQKDAEVRDALVGMVEQFACYGTRHGGCLHTGGLSALEDAFRALGWPNPKPRPDRACDEPDCVNEATCGAPTDDGYRRVCSMHFCELVEERR